MEQGATLFRTIASRPFHTLGHLEGMPLYSTESSHQAEKEAWECQKVFPPIHSQSSEFRMEENWYLTLNANKSENETGNKKKLNSIMFLQPTAHLLSLSKCKWCWEASRICRNGPRNVHTKYYVIVANTLHSWSPNAVEASPALVVLQRSEKSDRPWPCPCPVLFAVFLLNGYSTGVLLHTLCF